MRFFDRTEEIASLKEIQLLSKDNAQFTVVTGRRRIGKTHLVWKAYEDLPILYFFVARKAESDLCSDYLLEIETKLGIPTMGKAERLPSSSKKKLGSIPPTSGSIIGSLHSPNGS